MPDTRYVHTIVNLEAQDARFQVFVPDGYEGRPRTAKELLERAKALLQEEGRWFAGDWFRNEHPDLDPEDAFCNDWGVCMDGALIVVDVGMRERAWSWGTSWSCPSDSIKDRLTNDLAFIDAPLVLEARALLVEAGEVLWPEFVAKRRRLYNDERETYFRPSEVALRKSYGVEEYTEETYQPFTMYVPAFNDDVCKTRTKAIEWLDKAIELAEQSNSTG